MLSYAGEQKTSQNELKKKEEIFLKRQLYAIYLLKTCVGKAFTAGSVGPVPLLAAGEAAVAQRGARR